MKVESESCVTRTPFVLYHIKSNKQFYFDRWSFPSSLEMDIRRFFRQCWGCSWNVTEVCCAQCCYYADSTPRNVFRQGVVAWSACTGRLVWKLPNVSRKWAQLYSPLAAASSNRETIGPEQLIWPTLHTVAQTIDTVTQTIDW